MAMAMAKSANLFIYTGVVRAPFFTTFMQVFSRYAIVWGVTDQFPGLARASPAYASMLVAWSTTEVIRYSYFALTLAAGGKPPAALHWLRYHAFFVLYPVGISSEAWLIWRAVEPARDAVHPYYSTALFLYVVTIYPPCKSTTTATTTTTTITTTTARQVCLNREVSG